MIGSQMRRMRQPAPTGTHETVDGDPCVNSLTTKSGVSWFHQIDASGSHALTVEPSSDSPMIL